MELGDLVVCGVSANVVIGDISVNVPKGVAIRIPGFLANKSKDLWVLLSQGTIFRCDVSRVLRGSGPKPLQEVGLPMNTDVESGLRLEIDCLRSANVELQNRKTILELEVNELQTENAKLQTENANLQRRLGEKEDQWGKLDSILALLQRRNVDTFPLGQSSSPLQLVSDDVPRYIPSQIRPDIVDESLIKVQESSSEGDSVKESVQALKRRKIR